MIEAPKIGMNKVIKDGCKILKSKKNIGDINKIKPKKNKILFFK